VPEFEFEKEPPVLGFKILFRNQRNVLHILHIEYSAPEEFALLALQSCKRPSGWGIPKRTGYPHPPRLLPYTKPILEKELLAFLSRENVR
jgi:hypothetical protein